MNRRSVGWRGFLLAFACLIGSVHAAPPAPAFTVTTLHDGELALEDLGGKVVLLQFWASWCGSCIRGLPAIRSLYEQHAGEHFEIVGISLDEDPKAFFLDLIED